MPFAFGCLGGLSTSEKKDRLYAGCLGAAWNVLHEAVLGIDDVVEALLLVACLVGCSGAGNVLVLIADDFVLLGINEPRSANGSL